MGKLLTILGIHESVQENLPTQIFQGEQMINVMQSVYESAPESNKKTALSKAISESVRLLLLEIEKYKSVDKKESPNEEIPKEESPKMPELPFKVGDKFCMKNNKKPYLIESIDENKGTVTISGFDMSGNARREDFDVLDIKEKIEKGKLFTCPEKKKRGRQAAKKDETPKTQKTEETKSSAPEPPKQDSAKKEAPKSPPKKQKSPEPQPTNLKIHDPEITKKIRDIQEQIEEINDTLVAFEEGTEDYEELMTEIKTLEKQIKDLKK